MIESGMNDSLKEIAHLLKLQLNVFSVIVVMFEWIPDTDQSLPVIKFYDFFRF